MYVGRFLIAIVGFSIASFSFFLSIGHVNSQRTLSLGTQIERGAYFSGVEATRELKNSARYRIICRRDIQLARLANSLAIIDTMLSHSDAIVDLDLARSQAIKEWTEALKCFPLQGTIWASAAMAQLRLEGPTDEALSFAEISQLTSPLEVRALQQRILFLVAFSQTGSEKASTLLREDIERLLRSGDRRLLSGIDALLGEYGRKKIEAVLLDHDFQNSLRASDPKRLILLEKFFKVDPNIENCAPLLRRINKCDQKIS